MTDRSHPVRPAPRTASTAALLLLASGLCASLAGCASVGDSMASSAFVDPARYDQYDCKQLENERKTIAFRTAELQGLMAKAETGTGGVVIAELAYRNDYISTRGQARLADEVWQRNKCVATLPASAAPVAPAPAAPAPGKGHGSARSGSAIY
ncbi:twin-arginine translocation pathway signal [Bradyrhizobium sp.]|uniref:twin-arginine translocation pathway signal n=1 Tax=Bradyrhizobium sp. TaxID=376 RepID=UPI002E09E47C|nr:twin-arginine translocation pathway signal [Bradyrhizobium sp.]